MQVRPRALDLLQLAETVFAEIVHGVCIARLGRVYAELPVEQRPREPQRALERERPVGEPQVQVESERRPLERSQDVHVERNRVRDDLVKKILAEFYLALPQRERIRLTVPPPELRPAGDRRIHGGRHARTLVEQRDRAAKEPLHLIAEPRPNTRYPTAITTQDPELLHEFIERSPKHQLAVLRPHRFGTHPRQEQARQRAVGQLCVTRGGHDQLIWTVGALELEPVAGVGALQTAQREQPRHEAEFGVGLARLNELVDLVETGEVVPALGVQTVLGRDHRAARHRRPRRRGARTRLVYAPRLLSFVLAAAAAEER